jgi:hypothetical protein
MKKTKYIKPNKDFIMRLQDFILSHSNAGLVSIKLHFACLDFEKKLKEIPLSNELQ